MASVSNEGFLWCLASTLLGLSLFIKIAFTWNLLYLTPQLSLNYWTWRIHSNIIFVFNIQYVYVCIYIYIKQKNCYHSFKHSIGFSHNYQGKRNHKAEICTGNPLLFLWAFMFHFQKTKLWGINLLMWMEALYPF